jgi:hypothetical protein
VFGLIQVSYCLINQSQQDTCRRIGTMRLHDSQMRYPC